MDHLACMATFVAVVEKGGFASAARYLSVAPATVTQQIHALEHRLGARLLQRTTRKSTLTEAGSAFYERSTRILESIKEADAVASEFHATAKGTLRLNTSPTLSTRVSMIVTKYIIAHPETSFELNVTNEMGGLIDDRIDLAIRDDALANSSLIVRCLAPAAWALCGSAAYIGRHGLPTHPSELARHNCLVYGNGGENWHLTSVSGVETVRVAGSLRSTDPHTIRTAALSGQGLILLPEFMVRDDLQQGRLLRILKGYTAQEKTIRAVFPSNRYLPVKVRAFLDFVAKAFSASAHLELTPLSTSSGQFGIAARPPGYRSIPIAESGIDGPIAIASETPPSLIAPRSGDRLLSYPGTGNVVSL